MDSNLTNDKRVFDAGAYGPMPLVILSRADLTPADKCVYVALASHRRPDHTAVWPSVARLATMTALSRDTVLSAVSRMEAAGLLVIERTIGRSSVYRLLQPEPDRSEKPTSRKNLPVGKTPLHQSEKPTTPVGISDPEVLNGSTSGNRTPLTPRDAGGVREVASHAPAEEGAGSDSPAPHSPAETVEQVIERINAAYREVFGQGAGLTSRERRKVRRGWRNGDAWWLSRVDAKAVLGGRRKAEAKADREFGLGWVQRHLADLAAAEKAKVDAKVQRQQQAVNQVKAVAAQQAEDQERERQRRRAEINHWLGLTEAEQERFRRTVMVIGPRTPQLVEEIAQRQAYRARKETKPC